MAEGEMFLALRFAFESQPVASSTRDLTAVAGWSM